MRLPATAIVTLAFWTAFVSSRGYTQTMAPTPNQAVSQMAQLQELTKKIEEQNAKIDMLSQEILKLELEVTNNRRPGVMIGEGAPGTAASSSTTATSTASSPAVDSSGKSGNGNSHTVARGETRTSMAKMHGVTVAELQT